MGAVVDLSGLRLNLLTIKDDILHLGGDATLQTIADVSHLPSPAGGILPKVAQLAAHLGLRHPVTVGGVLLNPNGSPETGLALIALEAEA